MVSRAQLKYPEYEFVQGDAESLDFLETRNLAIDFVIASDLVGHLDDLWEFLHRLYKACSQHTRIVITYYNFLWEGILRVGERFRWKMPQPYQNWLGMQDIRNLLRVGNFKIEHEGSALLLPKAVPVLADWVNSKLAPLRLFSWANLLQYFVAVPEPIPAGRADSCSVIVPCRNEAGNIDECVARIPQMGIWTELVFVDGASTDGTVEKIVASIDRMRGQRDIKLIHQIERVSEKFSAGTSPNMMLPQGKGDAVRKGFDAASGGILMILDADLTVPPEDLAKFYEAITTEKGGLIIGTRLVYPVDDEAMPVLNYWGNKFFSLLFTWMLDQPIKDTLCGTKVLTKSTYNRIKDGRGYFGDFDPFGDFDLLFGASRLGIQITEIPIHYTRRRAGASKVRFFRHGVLLIRMSLTGFRKLKLAEWTRPYRVKSA